VSIPRRGALVFLGLIGDALLEQGGERRSLMRAQYTTDKDEDGRRIHLLTAGHACVRVSGTNCDSGKRPYINHLHVWTGQDLAGASPS
jgi:hypothetical protein